MDLEPSVFDLPPAIPIIDCFLPVMAPVVLETIAECYDQQVTEIAVGAFIAVAYLEITLN